MHTIDLSYRITKDRQLRAFGLPPTQFSHVCSVDGGAAVNCEQWNSYIPHGCGTHTECLGHITPDGRPWISDITDEIPLWMDARLVHVKTRKLRQEEVVEIQNQWSGRCDPEQDRVVGAEEIREAIQRLPEYPTTTTTKTTMKMTTTSEQKAETSLADCKPEALILLIFPDPLQRPATFAGTNPPYLTHAAVRYIHDELQVQHLLVDLPSVDREDDGGKLVAHRTFFLGSPSAPFLRSPTATSVRTITELCCPPEGGVREGIYGLNLQLLSVDSDASPSRPVLFSKRAGITYVI